MYFLDFLSQYNRFLEGKVSAPDFAHWLFAYNDEMEESLSEEEWDTFLRAQHLAAEWTGELISESRFRDQLREMWSVVQRPANPVSFSVFGGGSSKVIRKSLQQLQVKSISADASPHPMWSNWSPRVGKTADGGLPPTRVQHRSLPTL